MLASRLAWVRLMELQLALNFSLAQIEWLGSAGQFWSNVSNMARFCSGVWWLLRTNWFKLKQIMSGGSFMNIYGITKTQASKYYAKSNIKL